VPYVVARDGNIYRLFDETKNWAYHLGPGAVGGNQHMSQRTVAIEISNVGALQESGDDLLTGYGDVYCSKADKSHYVKLPTEFRGSRYYAAFTAPQVESVALLVKFLCESFGIPLQLRDGKAMYQTFSSDEEARAWRGVSSHVNYRPSGKTDLGPAFPWESLL
jgi:N-acetyl-anhydromuramyl-L-alanine amidase AmpD